MHILELFSGTGSVGSIAKELGHTVTSVDNDGASAATHHVDLLTFDYTTLKTPDFVWASPPCTTYSFAAIWYKHRDTNGRALTHAAKIGDRLLRRTLEIITHFLKKNPKLLFCIENPRGYMRKQRELRDLIRNTTSYNQYGFPVYKPTDLFTNFVLSVKPAQKEASDLRICGSNANRLRSRLREKHKTALSTMLGRIPPRLVRNILKQAESERSVRRRRSRKRLS